jgi:hypothetical protein
VTTPAGTQAQICDAGPALGHTWVQPGAGISGRLSQRVSVFVTLEYNRGLDGSRGHSLGGRFGIRAAW